MKRKLTLATLMFIVLSANAFAQSTNNASGTPKKRLNKSFSARRSMPYSPNDQIGTWKLVSQKITNDDGQTFLGDSTNVFQRKILTPTTFVVTIEKKIPAYDNKKLVVSVAGGHYTLVNGRYEELTQYASFKGFETMKVVYKLTIEDGKLHTVGTVGESTTYDEVYVRED